MAATGTDVVVMVRPENVRLAPAGARESRDAGGLSGRVVQSSFHGARRSVVVEVNGNLMKADVPAMESLGDRVTLAIDDRAAWALAP